MANCNAIRRIGPIVAEAFGDYLQLPISRLQPEPTVTGTDVSIRNAMVTRYLAGKWTFNVMLRSVPATDGAFPRTQLAPSSPEIEAH